MQNRDKDTIFFAVLSTKKTEMRVSACLASFSISVLLLFALVLF